MKKISFWAILLTLIFSAVWLPVGAAGEYEPDKPFTAKAVYLYNIDTDSLIFEENSNAPMYPASTTKIMTCILALENTPDLDFEMVGYPQYVQEYLYLYQMENGAVSNGGLMAGEELSMRKLLHALMLPSANEAAMLIADHISESQEDFVALMNKRAKELGAKNTHFVNANGLFDEGHTTTAYDLAVMARHAMQLPGFMEIVTQTSYEGGPTNLHDNLPWVSTNKMMIPNSEYYYPGLAGIKTGTLPESGRCFVSTATRDGFTYLLVVLGCDYLDGEGNELPQNMAFVDTANLYDWVFENFKVKTLVEKGKYAAEIPLRLSMEKDHIKLMTADRFTSLINQAVDASSVTIVPEIPESIDAPVKKGDVIGEAKLILSGKEIGRVALLAAESVEASPVLILWERVKAIMMSFWFKFIVVFIVLLIVAYIILMIIRNRNRRRYSSGNYRPKRRI